MVKGKHAKHVKEPEVIEVEATYVTPQVDDYASSRFGNRTAAPFEDFAAPGRIPDLNEGVARHRVLTALGVVFGGLIALAAVAYVAGVIAFSSLMLPGTTIAGHDVSLKGDADVTAVLNEVLGDYTVNAAGQGVEISLSAADAGMAIDAKKTLEAAREGWNPWVWPTDVTKTRDLSDCIVVRFETTALEESLLASAEAINADATGPKNAKVSYDDEANLFMIVPEEFGTKIDSERLVYRVEKAAESLETNIELGTEVLVPAEVLKDDERLIDAAEMANAYLSPNLDLTLAGTAAASVNADTVAKWVVINDEYKVSLSDKKMKAWVGETAGKLSTVGSKRTYERPDGKKCTVEGGDYGWKVDEEKLLDIVKEAVQSGKQGEAEIPTSKEAARWQGEGKADWGKRYIDIDLTEQHARMYDKKGKLIWESDIVSGDYSRSPTPQGVYYIKSNNGGTKLVGTDYDGEKYETKVSYWMPFRGSTHGLHDADWQYAFGGSRYKNGYGSHGCVNLPVSKARDLHNTIKVGDVVVVHG